MLVKESIVPRESKEAFLVWLEETVAASDEEWEWIVGTLVNDEDSTDEELFTYFAENGVPDETIQELLAHREGFLEHGLDIRI